ncbi:protein transport protein Sec31A isoform X2 [Halyomorpha halys]|uniref:protein transport protein Sec31A isoform X2 n=1 Tax=Halyomorpha halys TaxID=286706 RepID=UPI0006D4FCDC
MKIKEIDRTVNTAWSPGDHHPILLAAGTAAQQLDASFNTSASLDILSLNLTDPSLDLDAKFSVPSQHRYHKVAWGGESPGVIVGGCDNGVIQMYNVSKLMKREDGLIANPEKHSGAVKALDFNPFQKNLLATGASNSEIFIWDMNNTSMPMSPGVKSQPLEDIAWLAWNRQVQHILASTFPTRNVVWDLRKNEPIIKLTDTTTRVRWKVVAWHPEVATQLCLASEEDSNPVIQLWDLRFATSPLKTFKGHTRGVLSLAWCNQDPDLLISSGKDNKILCWNPNSNNAEGEIVCEIPNSQQWIFEVSWCPRNPSLIASSSCDGHTSIYSITGSPATQVQTNTKIADSFPGMGDGIPDHHIQSQQPVVDLKKAPKWLRKPVGASFGFGGKLVTFGSDGVKLLQVEGDETLLCQARALLERLERSNFAEICQGKDDPIWSYLEASFSPQPRTAIRTLLGYNKESANISSCRTPTVLQNHNVEQVTDQFSNLGQESFDAKNDNVNLSNNELLNGGDSVFDKISAQSSPIRSAPFTISVGNDVDGQICKALLAGSITDAINICLNEGKTADALILARTAGPDVLADTQKKFLQKREGYLSYILNALVTEDWVPIVKQCDITSWKEALSALLIYCTDAALPDLCFQLGKRLEEAGNEYSLCAEICYIASGNIGPLINKRLNGTAVSVTNIQEMVELVLVAQGVYSSRGQVFPIDGDVAKVISLYCELLASEGALETALQYLKDSSGEAVNDLRERLYYALSLKSHPSATYQQPQQYVPQAAITQNNNRRASTPYQNQNIVSSQPIPANSFAKPPLPVNTALPQAPIGLPPAPQLPPTHHIPPVSSTPLPPSAQPFPPKSQAPPPPQMPFARSTPSPQIQGPATTTKKYVVDPSVTSGSFGNYGRSSSTLPYPQNQFQSNPGFQPFQPPGSSSAQPSYQNPPSNTFQPPVSTPTYQPFNQPQYPTASSAYQPPSSAYQQSVPSYQQASILQPNQQILKPQAPPPPTAQILSAQNAAPSGWNDPPALTAKSQPPPLMNSHYYTKAEPIAQNPITHPLYGAAPPQPTGFQPPQTAGFQPQQPANFPAHQQSIGFQQQQQQQQPGNFQQQNFQPPAQSFQPPPSQYVGQQPIQTMGGGYGDPPAPMTQARAPEPVKHKPPLPERYAHIQKTLDDLRTKCIQASQSNPMMKRKLDDVGKKLEALYDSLREEKLSDATIRGLQDLTKCIEGSDYHSGMGEITRLASGVDFTQVATFMTGLKILIQAAQQLRVN